MSKHKTSPLGDTLHPSPLGKLTSDAVANAPVEHWLQHSAHLKATAEELTSRTGDVRQLTQWHEEWEGLAAEAAHHRLDGVNNHLDLLGLHHRASSTCLQAAAKVVAIVRQTMRAVLAAQHTTAGQRALFATMLATAQSQILAIAERIDAHTSSILTQLRDTLPQPAPITGQFASLVHTLHAHSLTHRRGPSQAQGLTPLPEHQASVAGDLNSAEHIITLVSGVGSANPTVQAHTAAWAAWQVAAAAHRGERLAIITWHNYPAPPNLLTATSRQAARTGGRALTAHQHWLRDTNPHAQHTIIGHSYGSLVVAEAANHMPDHPNNHYITWGSPGLGQPPQTNSPLQAPHASHHHIPGDPIALAPVHGPSPARTTISTTGEGTTDGSGVVNKHWATIADLYLLGRGETNAHSAYKWGELPPTPTSGVP